MLTLFNNYIESGKISEALLVGRNLFNKNLSNANVFDAYFGFLCRLSNSLPSFKEQQEFVKQAEIALAFYSENADFCDDTVEKIVACQLRLNAIIEGLNKVEQERKESEIEIIKTHNNDCIKKLRKRKNDMYDVTIQEYFDKLLVEIGDIDGEINKDLLSDEQNKHYEIITKEITTLISSKMRELEYKNNIAYNKQAVNSFANGFSLFREDENKYKSETQLYKLVSSTLFAYDASRLFNETLIYYNHIYSYIFSKLNDDGKLKLTQYSFECEKKRR